MREKWTYDEYEPFDKPKKHIAEPLSAHEIREALGVTHEEYQQAMRAINGDCGYEPFDKPTDNCGNEKLYYLIALGIAALAGACLGVAGYWLLF